MGIAGGVYLLRGGWLCAMRVAIRHKPRDKSLTDATEGASVRPSFRAGALWLALATRCGSWPLTSLSPGC